MIILSSLIAYFDTSIGLEGVLEESHFTKQEALLDAMTNYYSEGYTAISNYKSKKLKEIIIQRGLPDCLRGALWQIWAGSDHFLRSNPGIPCILTLMMTNNLKVNMKK